MKWLIVFVLIVIGSMVDVPKAEARRIRGGAVIVRPAVVRPVVRPAVIVRPGLFGGAVIVR